MATTREGSDLNMTVGRSVEKVEAWSAHVVDVSELSDPDVRLPEDERRLLDQRLVRKCDFRLIPWLCLIYLLCFLDRTNIGMWKEQSVHFTSTNRVQATPDSREWKETWE